MKRRLVGSDLFRYRVIPWLVRREEQRGRRGALAVDWRPVGDLVAFARERGWRLEVVHEEALQTRPPSRTLAEDALRIVRDGPRLIRQHAAARGGRNLAAAEMYYSHLLAETRYPLPATLVCEISDALVNAPEGGVATADFRLLTQSAVTGRLAPPPPLRRLPDESERLPGLYGSLLGWDGAINYAHWLLDVLPRLALLDQPPRDARWLVPPKLLPFHTGLLEMLGIRPDRLVAVEPGWVRVERLLLLVAAERAIVPHAAPLRELRSRLVTGVLGKPEHASPWRRLYVSRSGGRRPLLNEAELLPILKQRGFETVRAEELPPDEQVRLFAEAAIVLGLHGAGIYNELFCNPGATVVELLNPGSWDHGTVRVAAALGHKHWFSLADDAGSGYASTYPPEKLEKLLDYALGEGSRVEGDY